MADLWGALAGIGASLWDRKNQQDDAEQAVNSAKELSPNVTQQASMWQNQQNMGNQLWAQKQNQTAMDKAGIGTNTDAFGTSSRTQNADGSWNLNTALNSGDQGLLDMLRGKYATGLGNLDMSGAYNVDGTYAKNFDALNRPALERNQQAQRDAAAAMGVGWGSGKGNEVLQSQLNDEQTRFGLSVQNAGHDAWNADQATLKGNLALGDTLMNNIKGRQTAAPEWGKYATVNAPNSAIVNKGDIDSNLGWAAGGGAGGSLPTYSAWSAPAPVSSSAGWAGGALSGAQTGNNSKVSFSDPSGVTNDYSFANALNDVNDAYGGDSLWSQLLPGKTFLSVLTSLVNGYNNFTPDEGGADYYSSSNPDAGGGFQTNYSNPATSYGGWGGGSLSYSNPATSYGGWSSSNSDSSGD